MNSRTRTQRNMLRRIITWFKRIKEAPKPALPQILFEFHHHRAPHPWVISVPSKDRYDQLLLQARSDMCRADYQIQPGEALEEYPQEQKFSYRGATVTWNILEPMAIAQAFGRCTVWRDHQQDLKIRTHCS